MHYIFCFLWFFGNTAFQSSGPDAIVGVWANEEKKTWFQIYKRGDKYFANIIGLKEPETNGNPKLDARNPDPSKRQNPLIGTQILNNLSYQRGEWSGGTIYTPREGKVFSVYLTLESANKLAVTGYKGNRLFSKTQYWYRSNPGNQ